MFNISLEKIQIQCDFERFQINAGKMSGGFFFFLGVLGTDYLVRLKKEFGGNRWFWNIPIRYTVFPG